MMLKIYYILVLIVVIYSHSSLFVKSADDDFAEFDSELLSEQYDPLISNNLDKKDNSIHSKEPPTNYEKVKEDSISSSSAKKSKLESNIKDNIVEEDDIDKSDDLKKEKKKDNLKLVNAPAPRIYTLESYYVEFAFLFASILYFVNFFLGSSTNCKFAQSWYERSKEMLKLQFTLVGGAPQFSDSQKKDDDTDLNISTNKKQRGLIKTTESMYTLWCSGRIGVDGLLIEINLLKRQDLFSMALNLLKPAKDTMILRFLLNQEGYENFVFCLAHKAFAPKLARDMVDINTFCPKRKPISQFGINSERLFVMSELSDVASFILDQRLASFVQKYEQSINYIHITDQYSTIKSEEVQPAQKLANAKRMATFSLNLPRDDTERRDYLQFSFDLLDRLRRFKLARDSKQKSEKNRQKITDIIQKTQFLQRQEAAQAKKEELRRIEKERIYNEDDPEKQRSWQKKEAKRELKKNKMRVKQLKVKSM